MRTSSRLRLGMENPKIAVFNRAKTPLGVPFDDLIRALQRYVDECVAPIWGTPARIVKSRGFVKGAWATVFLERAGDKSTEGIHDLTPDGLPLAKVYVKTSLSNGDLVSVSASHELVEMLVDPAINLMTSGPDSKVMYSYESADPVEEITFNVNGIAMSDFVYPAYFETFHKPNSVRFDHAKKVHRPFQILSGGYQQVFKRGRWVDVAGSSSKKKRFALEDRRGHRTVQRAKRQLRRSDANVWRRDIRVRRAHIARNDFGSTRFAEMVRTRPKDTRSFCIPTPVESIQEFRVSTSNHAASFSGAHSAAAVASASPNT